MSSTSRRAGMTYRTPHRIEGEHETDPAVVRQTARDLQAELNSQKLHCRLGWMAGTSAKESLPRSVSWFLCQSPKKESSSSTKGGVSMTGTSTFPKESYTLALIYEALAATEDIAACRHMNQLTVGFVHPRLYHFTKALNRLAAVAGVHVARTSRTRTDLSFHVHDYGTMLDELAKAVHDVPDLRWT